MPAYNGKPLLIVGRPSALSPVLDITEDDSVILDDDDESGICDTEIDGFHYLKLGLLTLKMTKEQEERLRYFFENT